MPSPDLPLMGEAMHLCWVIACSRCKDEQAVDHPDDLARSAALLQEMGWTASMKKNTIKHTLAPVHDTSDWPDEIVYVLCPLCSGHARV